MAGEGRYFISGDAKVRVQATIENCVDSVLCTVLRNDGAEVCTVEHLLSSLEILGVDNCRIEIDGGNEVCFISLSLSLSLSVREKYLFIYKKTYLFRGQLFLIKTLYVLLLSIYSFSMLGIASLHNI